MKPSHSKKSGRATKWYIWTPAKHNNCIVGFRRLGRWRNDIDGHMDLWQRFLQGHPLIKQEWPANATAYWEEWTPYTDFPSAWPTIPLHSPRLRHLLERLGLGSAVQWLPIRIVGTESRRVVATYYVANYLHLVSCFDYERSEYDAYRPEENEEYGAIIRVHHLVLRRSALEGFDLFRVKEDEGWVIIHEKIKNALEAADITGCYFEEVETS